MIDFAPLPQSAVLPVDDHFDVTHTAIPVVDVIDNYPPLPPKK